MNKVEELKFEISMLALERGEENRQKRFDKCMELIDSLQEKRTTLELPKFKKGA